MTREQISSKDEEVHKWQRLDKGKSGRFKKMLNPLSLSPMNINTRSEWRKLNFVGTEGEVFAGNAGVVFEVQ